jgi:hypothetical protein
MPQFLTTASYWGNGHDVSSVLTPELMEFYTSSRQSKLVETALDFQIIAQLLLFNRL